MFTTNGPEDFGITSNDINYVDRRHHSTMNRSLIRSLDFLVSLVAFQNRLPDLLFVLREKGRQAQKEKIASVGTWGARDRWGHVFTAFLFT